MLIFQVKAFKLGRPIWSNFIYFGGILTSLSGIYQPMKSSNELSRSSLCINNVESTDHIFLTCPLSCELWKAVSALFCKCLILKGSFKDLILKVMDHQFSSPGGRGIFRRARGFPRGASSFHIHSSFA